MRLHYKGKYNMNPDSLPHGIHKPGAVPFKEAADTKTLGVIANGIGGLLIVLLAILAVLGTLGIGMGAGDYYNVFNAIRQMPKGARTYMYKFNSYWCMP